MVVSMSSLALPSVRPRDQVAVMKPIEDVLRDFAQPFVNVGWSNGTHASQAALDVAAVIWDLVIDGLSSREIVDHLEEQEDSHWAKIVDAFVERKRLLFESDRRYVVGSRIARRD